MTPSETRPAAIAPIAYIFQANDGLIRQTLSDLPAEAFWKQPGGHGNSIMWIVGHITQTRAGMLSLLGERASTGWGELFVAVRSARIRRLIPNRRRSRPWASICPNGCTRSSPR